MKMFVMHRKIILSILIMTVLTSVSILVVGCGEVDDEAETADELVVNNPPSIGAIPDQTVDVGSTVEVEVTITDADVGDTHTINASSDDTTVAAVSVDGASLTITSKAAGTTTITVTAKDDSGQDNAKANPVTFKVSVNEVEGILVPRDPAYSDLLEAWDDGDDDLVDKMFNRATKLRAGLEFRRDTFAVNEEQTILVAHTDEGKGLVLIGRSRFEVRGDLDLGWITYVKRGALRVLTHYDP